MKARDWLVSHGLAKSGRGKFSKEAHIALEKAMKDGQVFSDYPKSEKPVKASTKNPTKNSTKPIPTKKSAIAKPAKKTVVNAKPTESAPVDSNSVYLFDNEYRYPESEYKAMVNGKQVSLRECCNTCRVSLVNHACYTPTIHDSVAVQIVRR